MLKQQKRKPGPGRPPGRYSIFKYGCSPEYRVVHLWLNRAYPRTGRCEACGKNDGSRTEYSFLYHPKPHTRNREDYRELCMSCHRRFDFMLLQFMLPAEGIQAT